MHCSCTPSAASKHFLLALNFLPLCHPHLCPVASLKPVALGARIGTTQGPTSRKPALALTPSAASGGRENFAHCS